MSNTKNVLITGVLGQIGTEIALKLADSLGKAHVFGLGLEDPELAKKSAVGTYMQLDVTRVKELREFILKNDISEVYHLAGLLSGTSEKRPHLAWRVNVDPLLTLLEMAKEGELKKIFWPSSISVFGREIPKYMVSQEVPLNPTTVYGISKVAGEKWCEYYRLHYNVDIRSIRYPGLISWKAPAGGGTTDYAVEIFYGALEKQSYTSFISENTAMPMLYMDDAVAGTLQLMETPFEHLPRYKSYNLGGLSFTPAELAAEIKKLIPGFTIDYHPDFRQAIADSWPASIDDTDARQDWKFEHKFGLAEMTKDMLEHLREKLGLTEQVGQ